MDEVLKALSRDGLIEQASKLRAGIRAHRDLSGHDLCWQHPALWALEDLTSNIAVPARARFIRDCIGYRQSLDQQGAHAPRTREEFQG